MRELAAGCHFQLCFPNLKSYYTEGYQNSRVGAQMNVAVFQDWNYATGLSELLAHEFFQELNGPYRTRFSDGSEALVNTTNEVRKVDKVELPPESILLRFADGRILKAAPRSGWDISKSTG